MLRTIFAKSGLSTALTSEQLYLVADAAKGGSLLGIKVDETADEIKIYFKDNGNTAANEVLTLDTVDGQGATAAEDIINAINGLTNNAQVIKVSDLSDSVNGVNGVQIPVFTIANTDVEITATAEDDFTFTLGGATVGCTFSAVLTMDDESHTFTETGTIATPSDTIQFDSTSFGAGTATLVVTLTNPYQPNVTRVVSSAATIAEAAP